ncbi:MAG: hypothetical protein LBD91_06860 [Prevotellaceae bacterium]|jgi:hypothetical protein|nr:hypothetical protein [Prevotellaceae bacterium]
MKTIRFLTLLIAGATALSGCLGDYNPPEQKRTDVIVIINEGDTAGNGSVRFYIENQSYLNPAIYGLSGNIQSAMMFQEHLWVAANNPDKLSSVDLIYETITELPITELQTPRQVNYYAQSSGNKLFVSNWGDSITTANDHPNAFVAVYNLSNYSSPPTILPCGSDAEGMFVHVDLGKLFVATKQGVVVFDLTQTAMPRDTLIRSTQFSGNAKQFVIDSTGVVWVSYSDGGLMGFNPETYAVVREHAIPVDPLTGAIATDQYQTKVISYGSSPAAIYATDLSTGAQTMLVSGSYNFTGIGVYPVSGNIYAADTKADGKSTLLVFDKDGRKLAEETNVGIRTKGFSYFMVIN